MNFMKLLIFWKWKLKVTGPEWSRIILRSFWATLWITLPFFLGVPGKGFRKGGSYGSRIKVPGKEFPEKGTWKGLPRRELTSYYSINLNGINYRLLKSVMALIGFLLHFKYFTENAFINALRPPSDPTSAIFPISLTEAPHRAWNAVASVGFFRSTPDRSYSSTWWQKHPWRASGSQMWGEKLAKTLFFNIFLRISAFSVNYSLESVN